MKDEERRTSNFLAASFHTVAIMGKSSVMQYLQAAKTASAHIDNNTALHRNPKIRPVPVFRMKVQPTKLGIHVRWCPYFHKVPDCSGSWFLL